jgi:hypothetical protein
MSHIENVKRDVRNDTTISPRQKSVAYMNWRTNKPNIYDLNRDEIKQYKKMISDRVCGGACCK